MLPLKGLNSDHKDWASVTLQVWKQLKMPFTTVNPCLGSRARYLQCQLITFSASIPRLLEPSRALLPSANLFSSSVLPMALAAEHICLSTSSRRLMQRMMLPTPDKTQSHGVLVCESLDTYFFFKNLTMKQISWLSPQSILSEYFMGYIKRSGRSVFDFKSLGFKVNVVCVVEKPQLTS